MSTTLEHWARLPSMMRFANRVSCGWTDARDRELMQLICEGMSYLNMDAHFGLVSGACSRRAAQLGLRTGAFFKTRYFTEDEIALIRSGKSVGLVARSLGLSRQRVAFLRETELWPKPKTNTRQDADDSAGTK